MMHFGRQASMRLVNTKMHTSTESFISKAERTRRDPGNREIAAKDGLPDVNASLPSSVIDVCPVVRPLAGKDWLTERRFDPPGE